MSDQEGQPTRVGLTIGSTRQIGEFDFSKISLSLERDLVPAENPIDAYRDIKALLERMVTEFQEPKPVSHGRQEFKTQQTITGTTISSGGSTPLNPPKTQQTGTGTPTLPASKPAGISLEMVRERLAKWLPDLEILDGFDGFAVKPKRFLGEVWSEVNEVVRALGGKWVKGTKPADGTWRIPK